jgi:hypothetical protein
MEKKTKRLEINKAKFFVGVPLASTSIPLNTAIMASSLTFLSLCGR